MHPGQIAKGKSRRVLKNFPLLSVPELKGILLGNTLLVKNNYLQKQTY
jgi:hypothetical protein